MGQGTVQRLRRGGRRNRAEGLRSKRGSSPVWFPVVLVLAGLSWAAGSLKADASEQGFTQLDPSRVSLSLPSGTRGLPQDWSEIVALKLARLGDLTIQDEAIVDRIRAEIEALPFVREVGDARVLWPDGVSIDVRLREPIACICLGEQYLPVSSDGVILPSAWPEPPDFGRGLLPVIGPVDRTFQHAIPGERLEETRHLDALSVAISMREHVTLEDLRAMGPVVIDATDVPRAAVNVAGTHLYLAGARDVYFGLPPSYDSPGELPEAHKWHSIVEAVQLLLEPSGKIQDWDLLDARWDTPTLRPRIGYQ
jgi:hypothetical protein